MNWIDIGHIEDIPLRGARVVKTPAGCVAVFRTGPDQVYAVSDTCPHKGGPLSDGIVHDRKITCPLHNMVFDLETGLSQGIEKEQIATYPIRVEDGRLMLNGESVGKRSAA
ncbi:nitrite reductase small subunit NirD [Pseudooceanicola algae]|uniref:Naphthalene 1,2-dioxygenase/salicylate 5-hydroxylase systems, ferredoxin component n=1 Tax=Pseudooceanicola algae TaxID=1537215 RepID=A0A418SB43_9RHOB|nr:nitrite reductase small subunit NirD [Pseudooceanicola algae]QPM91342.1 Naphthalene 1,2-dioxygenase/salicylate 5-hydroxylase systems, ferredoxin component [Pseudooceanicola algae]